MAGVAVGIEVGLPLQSAIRKVVVLQDSLVACGQAGRGHLLSSAQLTVVEPHNKQIPALVLISPNFCFLHLRVAVRAPEGARSW